MAALTDLTPDEKRKYVEALIPLVRVGKAVKPERLRRLYQLFAMIEMPAAERIELTAALFTRLRIEPDELPYFSNRRVRESLLREAIALAGTSQDEFARSYIARLSNAMGVEPSVAGRWMQLFERLTDVENRVASILGKKGHVVRAEDRSREVFKKAVATVLVPAAVLFPLGTVGLSADGITTGLVALGGGMVLPEAVAMGAGLGVAIALGVTTKKILDMLIPTTDADRASVDLANSMSEAARLRHAFEEALDADPDLVEREEAREHIAEMINRLLPLNETTRMKVESAAARARELGRRYLDYLREDSQALDDRNILGAAELESLLELDATVIE